MDAAKWQADKAPNVKTTVVDAQYDNNKQASQFDNFISEGVDGILVWPMVEAPTGPPARRAVEAGIPVVSVDRLTGYDGVTSRVTGNFPANGAQAGMARHQHEVRAHGIELLGVGLDAGIGHEIEGSEGEPAHPRHPRQRAGREALRQWLYSEPEFGDQRITFLAQLYLLHGGHDTEQMRTFLHQTRAYFEQRLAWLRELEAGWLKDYPGGAADLPAADLGPYMTVRAGIHAAAARLAWCDESLGRLEGRRPTTAGGSRATS